MSYGLLESDERFFWCGRVMKLIVQEGRKIGRLSKKLWTTTMYAQVELWREIILLTNKTPTFCSGARASRVGDGNRFYNNQAKLWLNRRQSKNYSVTVIIVLPVPRYLHLPCFRSDFSLLERHPNEPHKGDRWHRSSSHSQVNACISQNRRLF
jgi:hypothetical protein